MLPMIRVSIAMVCIAAGLGARISSAAEPLVSLLISKVTAEHFQGDVLVTCQAVIDNATGHELVVRSNFFSAFDGLEIVVTNDEGKVLEQRGYIDFQSPFKLDGRDFPLKQGKTVKTLTFILSDIPEGIRSVRVRLVGTLPGSSYKRILSSETRLAEIDKRDVK